MCPVISARNKFLLSKRLPETLSGWSFRNFLAELRQGYMQHKYVICLYLHATSCYIILYHSFYSLNGTDGLSPLTLTGLQFFDSSRSKERSLSVYLCLRNRHSPRIARRPKAAQFKIPLRIPDQLAGGTVVGRGGIQARHPHTHLIHGTSGNTSGTLNGDPPTGGLRETWPSIGRTFFLMDDNGIWLNFYRLWLGEKMRGASWRRWNERWEWQGLTRETGFTCSWCRQSQLLFHA